MGGAVAVFLISLGLGQLISTRRGWRAASLVGPGRWAGYGLGLALIGIGWLWLPSSLAVLGWTLVTGPLALSCLLAGGSFIMPPPDPHRFFAGPACRPVQIPDGDSAPIPGLLIRPARPGEMAVCLAHGGGDRKTAYKWRLVQALVAEGLTVLTIDLPGHGEYRHRLLAYPDCLSVIPAALDFLGRQPGLNRIGLIGLSLGGAMALHSIRRDDPPDALVIWATPTHLHHYNRRLVYREIWNTARAPLLSLLAEISLRQIWQTWRQGGYRSRHSSAEMIERLAPLDSIQRIRQTPILLLYSRRDSVATAAMGRQMQQAAPEAILLESKNASHLSQILTPALNRRAAGWLRRQLAVNNKCGHRA